jgi:hypothetical protein
MGKACPLSAIPVNKMLAEVNSMTRFTIFIALGSVILMAGDYFYRYQPRHQTHGGNRFGN